MQEIPHANLLIPIVAVAVVLFGVIVGAVSMAKAKRGKNDVVRWARGAYSVWTGGEDCGTWPKERANAALRDWYGVDGGPAFWKLIASLSGTQGDNVAWDSIRALDLLRIGTAATHIDDDQCWIETAKLGKVLQQRYADWDALAKDFEVGMQAWQRSRGVTDDAQLGRVQRNLPKLRGEIWPAIGFKAPLVAD